MSRFGWEVLCRRAFGDGNTGPQVVVVSGRGRHGVECLADLLSSPVCVDVPVSELFDVLASKWGA